MIEENFTKKIFLEEIFMNELNHFDEKGAAIMVDVSEKKLQKELR